MHRFRSTVVLKCASALEQLLTPDFRFYPCPGDSPDWLEADYWDREAELELLRTMFGHGVPGSEPIDSIEVEFERLSEDDLTSIDGSTRVPYRFVIQALTGPDRGWIARTRLDVLIVADATAPGRFSIREMRELALPGPNDRELEEDTWAGIKARYYEP